ncbi:hypothetical protein CXB51_005330 [Gossypium anomalum]|uniref:DUF4283 domain-containing protein n=1 Tax=Gossypium anomalum TaxID=47600 RepID=A0A8J5ZMH3_9ROSI|nr:hypothetical protein CXB51_005330 [Gossypium anomalum]
MEDDLANLNLNDQEDDPVTGQEEDDEGEYEFQFCLIGRVLKESLVHFTSLRNVLSELWHPIERVTISKIEEKRILFCFYNKIDLKSMLDSILWFFNQHLIIFHKLKRGDDPLQVPLHYMNFWVQIHDLPLDQYWKDTVKVFAPFGYCWVFKKFSLDGISL